MTLTEHAAGVAVAAQQWEAQLPKMDPTRTQMVTVLDTRDLTALLNLIKQLADIVRDLSAAR